MEGAYGGRMGRSRRTWVRLTGVTAVAAGLAHGGLTPAHFAEWWGYGLFFLFAAAGQTLFGLALLTDAVQARAGDPRRVRWERGLLWAGIAGNVFTILLYAVTRLVGIPFFGPAEGETEAVGAIDLPTKVLEVVTIAGCVWLLKHPRTGTARP